MIGSQYSKEMFKPAYGLFYETKLIDLPKDKSGFQKVDWLLVVQLLILINFLTKKFDENFFMFYEADYVKELFLKRVKFIAEVIY